MPEPILRVWHAYLDLPIFLQIFVFIFVVLLVGFVIWRWLPSLRWMISWFLDNCHRLFAVVFVVFATTDLLARPGLTTVVDGIVVPTDSVNLTIELVDRAKIGVLIYALLWVLSSAYARSPNRLSPYPGQAGPQKPDDGLEKKLEERVEKTAHLLVEGLASLTEATSELARLPEEIRAAANIAGQQDPAMSNGRSKVTPLHPTSRSDGA